MGPIAHAMHTRLGACIFGVIACLQAAPGMDRKDEAAPKQVAVFPFSGQPAELGGKFADTLQMKMERNRPPFQFVERAEVRDIAEEMERLTPATPLAEVARLLREKFGDIHGAVYGGISKDGDTYQAEVCFLDLAESADELAVRETFSAEGERGLGVLAEKAGTAILGKSLKAPVEAGRVPEPAKLGPMASKNPGFEAGKDEQPDGWERVDGLTTFWVDGGSPLGEKGRKCIRLFTLLPQRQADEWWAKWRAGAKAKDAPEPLPSSPPHYDSVGGLHGAHFYSEHLPVKPGMRYRISADMKGKSAGMFFPKVFVKGYAETPPTEREKEAQRREIWRTYLACRNEPGDWRHYSEVFTPRSPSPKAPLKWMRIVIYAYWPPGEFFFDNVKITDEPGGGKSGPPAADAPNPKHESRNKSE